MKAYTGIKMLWTYEAINDLGVHIITRSTEGPVRGPQYGPLASRAILRENEEFKLYFGNCEHH